MPQGTFIISLDFELLWGVRDKLTIDEYGANIRGVGEVIPALLALFSRREVSATFATVGFLFARDRQELLDSMPNDRPLYRDPRLSPYTDDYLRGIGQSRDDDPYHYGAPLLDQIVRDGRHEVASHTFSHYYALEGASLASFAADVDAAARAATRWGITLTSMVFPRNQFSDAHLRVLKQMGYTAYRGNERSRFYAPLNDKEKNARVSKGMRLADSYLNLTGHHTYAPEIQEGLVNLPASRFLRPYHPKLRALDGLRMRRIMSAMDRAAKDGTTFHLWWHPHNFGMSLRENLAFLDGICLHFQTLRKIGGMRSLTVQQMAAEVLRSHV